MEADAKAIGDLTRGLQQRRRIGQIDAELAGEGDLGIFRGHPQPHAQRQIFRRPAIGIARRLDDLLQLLVGIEAEGAHARDVIGLGDGRHGLHRVHEAQHGVLPQRLAHQPHLGDGGGVEVGDAGMPQLDQQIGRGIRLHGIEALARKLLGKEAGGTRGSARAVQDNGFVGREGANYSRCIRMDVQFKGPPIGLAARTHRTKLPCGLEVPMGQRRVPIGQSPKSARKNGGLTASFHATRANSRHVKTVWR